MKLFIDIVVTENIGYIFFVIKTSIFVQQMHAGSLQALLVHYVSGFDVGVCVQGMCAKSTLDLLNTAAQSHTSLHIRGKLFYS